MNPATTPENTAAAAGACRKYRRGLPDRHEPDDGEITSVVVPGQGQRIYGYQGWIGREQASWPNEMKPLQLPNS